MSTGFFQSPNCFQLFFSIVPRSVFVSLSIHQCLSFLSPNWQRRKENYEKNEIFFKDQQQQQLRKLRQQQQQQQQQQQLFMFGQIRPNSLTSLFLGLSFFSCTQGRRERERKILKQGQSTIMQHWVWVYVDVFKGTSFFPEIKSSIDIFAYAN